MLKPGQSFPFDLDKTPGRRKRAHAAASGDPVGAEARRHTLLLDDGKLRLRVTKSREGLPPNARSRSAASSPTARA